MKNYILLSLSAMLISSCARIYSTPDALNKARTHKTIAVITPNVTLPPQKNMTPEQVEQLKKDEAIQLHGNMISWLHKRKEQGKISVQTVDLITTQTLLERKLKEISGNKLTIEENCTCLDVDGIMNLNLKMTKPMSTGAAIATTLLFGFGNTNQIVAYMGLYHCKDKTVIWTFNHTLNGGIFNTPEQLIDELMRLASKKLPYTKLDKK